MEPSRAYGCDLNRTPNHTNFTDYEGVENFLVEIAAFIEVYWKTSRP
jgi:hypothetical protein